MEMGVVVSPIVPRRQLGFRRQQCEHHEMTTIGGSWRKNLHRGRPFPFLQSREPLQFPKWSVFTTSTRKGVSSLVFFGYFRLYHN
uniref:Uncharacterized protein n=1 Tax=Triticum urartu TaxID=4572 RepID=A0A8R7QWB6_TRIUA